MGTQEIPQNPTRSSLRLEEGEVYTFKFKVPSEDGHRKSTVINRRMRLVKCYRHHAVFESGTGVRTSYRYWDIQKLLLGEQR